MQILAAGQHRQPEFGKNRQEDHYSKNFK